MSREVPINGAILAEISLNGFDFSVFTVHLLLWSCSPTHRVTNQETKRSDLKEFGLLTSEHQQHCSVNNPPYSAISFLVSPGGEHQRRVLLYSTFISSSVRAAAAAEAKLAGPTDGRDGLKLIIPPQ